MTQLLAAGVDTPLLDANVLLGEALGIEPARIPLCGERRLTERQAQWFDDMIQRRSAREPVAYIVGTPGVRQWLGPNDLRCPGAAPRDRDAGGGDPLPRLASWGRAP